MAETPGEPPIDVAHLRLYTAGDADLEKEIAALFGESCASYLAGLENAASDHDWKQAAHALKGASRGVGAFALGTLAEKAETMLGPRAAERPPILAAIRESADTALGFMRELTK